MKYLKAFFRWVFMKKKDITDSGDLYFYHTKRIILILVLFLGVSFLSALTFISLFQGGEMTISVPDVMGKTLIQAQLRLQRDDLHFKIKTQRFNNKPAGIILAQEPSGGSTTKKQRAVLLFVNSPSAPGTVPNLSGLTESEAAKKLVQSQTSNFRAAIFRKAYSFSDDVPAGRVIAQTPTWGEQHPSPVYVNLLISKGSSSRKATLPNFAGQNVEQAMRWIALNNGTPKVVSTPTGTPGRVASQTPAAGSAIAPGQLILLKSGPGKKYGLFNMHLPQELKLAQVNLKRTTVISTNSALTEAERKLKEQMEEQKRQQSLILKNRKEYPVSIILLQNGVSTTLLQAVRKPGDRIILTFPYSGQVTLHVRIDNRLFFTRKYL